MGLGIPSPSARMHVNTFFRVNIISLASQGRSSVRERVKLRREKICIGRTSRSQSFASGRRRWRESSGGWRRVALRPAGCLPVEVMLKSVTRPRRDARGILIATVGRRSAGRVGRRRRLEEHRPGWDRGFAVDQGPVAARYDRLLVQREPGSGCVHRAEEARVLSAGH